MGDRGCAGIGRTRAGRSRPLSSMTLPKTVSVIIPVWNGSAFLPACLEALLAQAGRPFEIIAVDNASSDGSAALVAERYPQVTLIRHERNLGFAGGCNAGMRAAAGDILILLNQDTLVEAGWLQALLTAFDNPAIGIAGCKSLYPGGQVIQHAGGFIEWPRGWAQHYGYRQPDGPAWSQAREVDFVTGAALALRRAVLEGIGPLDEGFWPGYYEDADFCWRARAAGFGVWYWPAARLTHHETKSPVKSADLERYLHVHRLRFVLKHLAPERIVSETVPAEYGYQRHLAGTDTSLALHWSYLEAALIAPELLAHCHGRDAEIAARVTAALLDLYRDGWQADSEALINAMQATANAPFPGLGMEAMPKPQSRTFFQKAVVFLGLEASYVSLQKRWHASTGRTEMQWRVLDQQRHLREVIRRLEFLADQNAQLTAHLALRPTTEAARPRPGTSEQA